MAGAPATGEVDENEGMAWELLYNVKWQLPTEELGAGWKDATGETSVMKVCTKLLSTTADPLSCWSVYDQDTPC